MNLHTLILLQQVHHQRIGLLLVMFASVDQQVLARSAEVMLNLDANTSRNTASRPHDIMPWPQMLQSETRGLIDPIPSVEPVCKRSAMFGFQSMDTLPGNSEPSLSLLSPNTCAVLPTRD